MSIVSPFYSHTTFFKIAAFTCIAAALLIHDGYAGVGKTDAQIFALIDSLRQDAALIQVDGNASDWDTIPTFYEVADNASGDSSRDIIKVAIAPTDLDLLVMIATGGAPSQENLAFWLDIDLLGYQLNDVQIGISTLGPHTLWIFEENQPAVSTTITGLDVAIGQVVEIRIPFAVLAQALPPAMAQALTGANARSWIRVAPFTWNINTVQYVEFGPAVASYRLITTPYALDPPLPQPGGAPLSVELSMDGKWYIGQGAFGLFSHQNVWAYDLYVVDDTLSPATTRGSLQNTDYYSWGRAVYSPTSASVIFAEDSNPDSPPFPPPGQPPGNNVLLDIGSNVALWLVHFQQSGLAVAAGDTPTTGSLLGHIGNSGNSTWPHLHMGFYQLPQATMTLPMALANVNVSLNNSRSDPWTRTRATWEPREGFLVERLVPFVPNVDADFDADGTSDIVVIRGGAWLFHSFASGAQTGGVWTGGGGPGCTPAPMDYDGDGKVKPTQLCGGAWHFYNANGSYNKGIWVGGVAGDLPVPADYDGDGTDEVVIFRGGAWLFYDFATGLFNAAKSAWTGGGGGCIPVPMDYNGDGKKDFTQLCGGSWHFYNANGSYNKGIWTGGVPGDKPVPADYDGIGTEQVVLFRGGAWLFYDFATGLPNAAKHVWTGAPPHWTGGTSLPAPIDYDGNGTVDFTVYSGGPWHFYNTNGSYHKGIWTGGVVNDRPISRRLLP